MTRSSILAKLKRELQQDLREESQVVYILVEIRKFIEQAGELDNYHALDFYCSLALHTTMTRIGARRILERFNRAYPILVKGAELPQHLDHEISDTISLKKFRDELKQFLSVNNLIPAPMFPGTPDAWVRFIHLYAGVTDECDLQWTDEGLIDRVTIHLQMLREKPGPEWGDQILFAIRWTCHGRDGLSGDHDVYFGYSPEG